MKKKNSVYLFILFLFLSLLSVLIWYFTLQFLKLDLSIPKNQGILALLIINLLLISYFWLNGAKDIVYTFYYFIVRYKLKALTIKISNTKIVNNPKVLLLYCTSDDFDVNSLKQSMMQKYSNFETFILDDSHKPKFINTIKEFALKHNVKRITRSDRKGYKAGNINNFLKNYKYDYDYFIILDSDEIIPNNFIEESLKYFNYYNNVGMVQGNHIATRNKNNFMKLFYLGINAHWPTYQTIKHSYGFTSLLGHGAMISKKCYDSVKNGFPELVAEDLGFAIDARNNGYFVAFAPNIICQEEFPVSYFAFKKRHYKWTQGNLEFIKKYTGKIFGSKKISILEKIDIFLFTYTLP